MTSPLKQRQRRARLAVSTPMALDEIELVDKAAALRTESRAGYIRRVIVREANADIREAERKSQAVA